jgi:hypothetical protein
MERSGSGFALFTAVNQVNAAEPHADGGVIPLNTWTHVAMTFDSSTGRLIAYINGQAVSTVVSPGAILATSRNVLIGREDSFLPRAFTGAIDEVGIYNRSLSAAEIQSIFGAGGNGKCKSGTGGGGTLGTCPSSTNIALAGTASQISVAFGGPPSLGNNNLEYQPFAG